MLMLLMGQQKSRFIRQCLASKEPPGEAVDRRPGGRPAGPTAVPRIAPLGPGNPPSTSTGSTAPSTQRAGGRLYRHVNDRIQCYVHKRLQRQQHRQLQRTLEDHVSSAERRFHPRFKWRTGISHESQDWWLSPR
jgi:hypothetical protein